uniref:Uncharacterized protein n=1 Tax=Aegilops tauschii subsp. strangulata TaxID=200361 RepID=A0A453L1B7_AEGTS
SIQRPPPCFDRHLVDPGASTLAPAEVTASMLAVAGGSAICGVAADNGTAYCIAAGAGSSAYNASASSVAPQLVFSQVSGGTGFLCGVGAVPGGGVTALFCWPPAAPRQLRRVYRGPAPLSDLAVGADHVAAYDGQARGIRWWRRGSGQPAPWLSDVGARWVAPCRQPLPTSLCRPSPRGAPVRAA